VDQVAVFPLPNVVLFPNTVLPLHVFEPRYRELVRDVSAGDGLIAVSLLAEGWEEQYEDSPPFERIATIGRIDDLRPLADGRYLLNLVGIERVALGEMIRDRPYRLVRFESRGESVPSRETPELHAAKLDLLAAHGCLLRELSDDEQPSSVLLNERLSLTAVVNGACANLPVSPPLRQSLLEEDDLLHRLGRVSGMIDEILKKVLELKAIRGENAGGESLN